MKIDFSKFKKIECDDKCTTLQHESGHQLKIAHKSLSPENKKELNELPVHMAKGGRAKFSQKFDPNIKGSQARSNPNLPGYKKNETGKVVPAKASGPAKSSNTMPMSTPMAKDNYTEPQDQGVEPQDVVVAALNREAPPFGALGAPQFHSPPCINSSCKSFGKPHPNCRCYGGKMGMNGGYAEGGEIDDQYFCDNDRAHFKGCEYYADGGSINKKENPDVTKAREGYRSLLSGKTDDEKAKEHANYSANYKMPTMQAGVGGFAFGAGPDDLSDSEKLDQAAQDVEAEDPENSMTSHLPDQAAPAPSPQPGTTPDPYANKAPEQAQAEPTPLPSPDVNPNPEMGDNAQAQGSTQETPAQPQQPQAPIDVFQHHKQRIMQETAPEVQNFKQDLDNGHITPETYSSLFAKKDTLGKVGTLFGLMLSGMGSGLAHQPNMLMEMMNKQIENDLNAQQKSQENKQNYLRINQANVLNQAQANNLNAEARSKAFALSRVQMNLAAYHKLVVDTQKMPEGPQKQKAMQALAMMNQGIQNENFNILDRAASAGALANMISSDSGGGPNTTMMKSGLMGPEAKEVGSDLESKTMPGIPGKSQIPLGGSDREEINSGVEFDKQLNNYINWAKKHSGDLNPVDRKYGQSLAAGVQAAYRQATHGGVYKEGEQNFISKIINDTPTEFFNKIRVLPSVQAVSDQHKIRMDQLLKSKGFPGYQGSKQSSQTSQGGSTIERMHNGRIILYDAKTKKPLGYK